MAFVFAECIEWLDEHGESPASDVVITLITPKKYYQKTSALSSFSGSLIIILNPVLATFFYTFGGMNALIAVDLRAFTITFLALMLFVQIPHVKLIIHFELGGWNLTDELKKRMNALIKASKKKVDEFRYKRIYFKDIKLSQDDYDESLRNVTNFY